MTYHMERTLELTGKISTRNIPVCSGFTSFDIESSRVLFPRKLWDVATIKGSLIGWNEPGTAISVNEFNFEKYVMKRHPGLVKIPTFANFRRQLRWYGFNWNPPNDIGDFEFYHPYFLKEKPELLSQVVTRRRSFLGMDSPTYLYEKNRLGIRVRKNTKFRKSPFQTLKQQCEISSSTPCAENIKRKPGRPKGSKSIKHDGKRQLKYGEAIAARSQIVDVGSIKMDTHAQNTEDCEMLLDEDELNLMTAEESSELIASVTSSCGLQMEAEMMSSGTSFDSLHQGPAPDIPTSTTDLKPRTSNRSRRDYGRRLPRRYQQSEYNNDMDYEFHGCHCHCCCHCCCCSCPCKEEWWRYCRPWMPNQPIEYPQHSGQNIPSSSHFVIQDTTSALLCYYNENQGVPSSTKPQVEDNQTFQQLEPLLLTNSIGQSDTYPVISQNTYKNASTDYFPHATSQQRVIYDYVQPYPSNNQSAMSSAQCGTNQLYPSSGAAFHPYPVENYSTASVVINTQQLDPELDHSMTLPSPTVNQNVSNVSVTSMAAPPSPVVEQDSQTISSDPQTQVADT